MANVKWAVDPAHSAVDFTIKHMMIAKVKGSFHQFEAQIEADPANLTTANILFSVDLSSIDNRNSDRDGHLRSGDFFDVENNAKMTFQSTAIKSVGDGEYKVTGDLNLHGVTRSETFNVS